MTEYQNLLGGPAPTLLPDVAAARGEVEAGTPPAEVVARYPAWSLGWALLAEEAYGRDVVESYAYARTGYHRGLDALRRAGWKGHGPIPWEHEPNRGFLRAVHALGRAAERIGEQDEAQRCRTLLADSSEAAVAALAGDGAG